MYKWLTVFMCVAGLAGMSLAGIEAGTLEISGGSSAMYTSQTLTMSVEDDELDGDIDLSLMTLAVDGVYYFGPMGAGATLAYMSATVGVEGDDIELSGMMFGPTAKFVHPVNDQLSVFGLASVGLARLNVTLDSEDIDETADGYFFRLGGGAKYFLTDTVSVDGTLSYQMASLDVDVEDTTLTVDASGFMLGVGLAVYLPTGGAM